MSRVPLAAGLAIAALFGSLATLAAPVPSGITAPRWHPIETTRYAWRKDAAPYTFIIEEDRPGAGHDDENSPRLRIDVPGRGEVIYTIPDGWYSIAEQGENLQPPVADNLIHSKYLYLAPKLTNARGEPALLLFGGAFASDPAAIRILALNAAGVSYVLLSEETFDLAEIKDIDGDGVAEVVGYRSLSQTFNDCVKTYDPVSVFRFNAARDKLVYSEALSRKYMEAHDAAWAGAGAREDVGVSMCGANKGHIVKPPQ